VGDAIAALPLLLARGHDARLTVAGAGDGAFAAQARALGVEAAVHFAGLVPATEIEALMRDADVVLLPSRPEYPEGFPLVADHALSARTPIAASDHPALTPRLHHRENAMVFPAGDPARLAACVEELLTDGELYARISSAAEQTLLGLRVDLEWGELIEAWLSDAPEDRSRLAAQALAPASDLAPA
jgi:glycosyltransferase involved in cell wall biosynthesis